MYKSVSVLAFLMIVVCMSACGGGANEAAPAGSADDAGRKWAAFVRLQTVKAQDGSFNVEKFRSEGAPLAADFAGKKGSDGKIAVSQEVMDSVKAAATSFVEIAQKKDNREAYAAFTDLSKPFSGQ